MRFSRGPFLQLFVALSLLLTLPLHAQQGCQAPAEIPASRAENMFSEEQENYLGDAIAEQLERDFRIISDDEITAYLQGIGDRILKHMPPTNLHFRFFLVDLPVANAYAAPGARIYVTRKLVASTHGEDELAGILAHEIGHVVTRQHAIRWTRIFREVLGVTQVGDRADIFEKYHLLLENYRRKPGAFHFSEREEEKDQLIADQVSVYAAARAGYSPDAAIAVFDRIAETQGKTGNWFTDLFGATKPEQKRLREMLRTIPKVPESCVERRPASAGDDYKKWQAEVIAYTGLGRKESLHGVLSKLPLSPPLRADIDHLKFSPDGKLIIAQDDSGIFVLSREPFETLFRIDAPDAYPAQFSPDSRFVVFYTPGLRVEKWSVEDQQRESTIEMVRRQSCFETALSPDGNTLACVETELHVSLIDVATGNTLFKKKDFYTADFGELLWLFLLQLLGDESPDFIHMGFSPDNRYFVASRNGTALALDMSTHTPISIPGSLKDLMSSGFAFFGSDRVVGLNGDKSAVARFPSGQVLNRLPLGGQRIYAASSGDYLLMRPIKGYPVGVMDLSTKKIFLANRKSAFDVYKDVFVSERADGELSLLRLADNQRIAKLALPQSPLGRVRTAGLSPDARWLAVSQRSRGGVWDLRSGERIFHTRGFRGVAFGDGDVLYADFPKYQETDRKIVQLDPRTREVTEGTPIEQASAFQVGSYLLIRKSAKDGGPLGENIILEVRDVRSFEVLWSRPFPKEAPSFFVGAREGVIVFYWPVSSGAAKNEMKSDPELKSRLASLKEKEGDYLLIAVDARNGSTRGKLLMETGKGSFRIEYVEAAGDWLAVSDNQNRVLIYSLSSGEQKGRMFGGNFDISKTAGMLCVETDRGKLALYNLATMQKVDEYLFSSPVKVAQFSDDGKRLFVLTANQVVYTLDVSDSARSSLRSSP